MRLHFKQYDDNQGRFATPDPARLPRQQCAHWLLMIVLVVAWVRVGGESATAQGADPASASVSEQLAQAEAYRAEAKWGDALAVLRQAAARRAEDPASAALAQLRLGMYLNEMAKPTEAEVELRKVQADFPQQTGAVGASKVHLIDALALQDRTREALAAAKTLTSEAGALPEHQAWGRVKLAQLLRKEDRIREILEQLDVLDGLPWSPELTSPKVQGGLVRGEVLIQMGRWKDAVAALDTTVHRSLTADPATCNWARVRMIQALVYDWSPTKAVEAAGLVIADHAAGKAVNEQAAWALIWKGRAESLAKDYTGAAESLEMAAAVADPDYPALVYEARFALGECYREDGQHEKALPQYQLALDWSQWAGLAEDKQDWARLQVGSELRHLGMREKGIACLRLGITDPSNLTPVDHILVERMASFMMPEEAEAWRIYLVSPRERVDPTDAMVRAKYGQEAPLPVSQIVRQASSRAYWLGQLYRQQRRYEEAISSFIEADVAAEGACERGEALKGLALTYHESASEHEIWSREVEAEAAKAAAWQAAEDAARAWLEAARSNDAGHAHYAIEQAILTFRELGLQAEALTASDTILAQIRTQGSPSKTAFAEYMRTRALAWNNRFAEAAELAVQLDRDYQAYPDADLQETRVSALIRASAYFTWAGDPASGLGVLNTVADRYPGQYDQPMERFYKLCRRSLDQ